MSAHQDAKLIGESLGDGETYRGDCPSCGRRNVYTVTRDGQSIVWNCYSASCGNSGRSGGGRILLVRQEPRKPKEINPYTGELEELDEYWREYLRNRIGWEVKHLDLGRAMYARQEGRIAYPIYGPMGQRRGWSLRSYKASDNSVRGAKSLTRLDVAEPHLSWYRLRPVESNLLVVEDIPSAVRAAFYWPQVVAMCGGGVGPDYVQELTAYARNVTWAFDPDATAVAIKHHRKYGIFFESSRVLALERDLKDMTEDALADLLRNNLGGTLN